MKLLLDIHIFLWHICADLRLPKTWRDAITDKQNEVFLSVVSVWEILVKNALGKLPLPIPPETYLIKARIIHNIVSLPLDEESVIHLNVLPFVHRDPFDRMLACQTIEHGMTFVTLDPVFKLYSVRLL